MEPWTSDLLRLSYAALLGGLIGYERYASGRDAGLRTHLLVTLGSALFMVISENLYRAFAGGAGDGVLRVDPGRIGAQIVTGIGFLGAGAIIKEGLNARGLTTAASLWVSAGIGMAAGAGFYAVGLMATLLALLALAGLNFAERFLKSGSYRYLSLDTTLACDIPAVVRRIRRPGVKVIYCDYRKDYASNLLQLQLLVKMFHRRKLQRLSDEVIADLEGMGIALKKIEWHH